MGSFFYRFALAVGVLFQPFVYGGGSSSGGTDNLKLESGTAWFLQDGESDVEIPYCLQLSPKFGLSASDVERAVTTTAEIWKNYIRPHKIEYGGMRFVFKFTPLPSCDGRELLTLYLGTSTTQTDAIRTKKYENPTAFSERTYFDMKSGLGRGFIWFAKRGEIDGTYPEWSNPITFQGSLLHELGHVFGISEHIDGTIMGNITRELKYGSKVRLQTIDWENELIPVRGHWRPGNPQTWTMSDFKNALDFYPAYKPDRFLQAFKQLVGRDPSGQVISRLKLDSKLPRMAGSADPRTIVLELQDEKGTRAFSLVLSDEADSFPKGRSVFSRVRSGHSRWDIPLTVERESAYLTTVSGETIDVEITHGQDSRIEVSYRGKDHKRYILLRGYQGDMKPGIL